MMLPDHEAEVMDGKKNATCTEYIHRARWPEEEEHICVGMQA